MSVFRLAMHPASDGDALMLSWGKPKSLRYALIDLGRSGAYKALKPRLQEIGQIELFVITHIDADHIAGAVPLFKQQPSAFTASNVWFNAYAQLQKAKERLTKLVDLGAGQAEKVTAGILESGWVWNRPFESGVVSTDSPEAKQPIALDGGLRLTLLSPDDDALSRLIPAWNAELDEAGLRTNDPDKVEEALELGRVKLGRSNVEQLASTPFREDDAEANGTSIAFIAEYDGKRVLLAADAHPGIIEKAIRGAGVSEQNRLKLDCFKVSHHGSKANTSNTLLGIIDCTRFAFSTDGSHHQHPDPESIARILKADPDRPKTMIFNYRQPSSEIWDSEALKKKWKYECLFPGKDKEGIEFDI